MIPTLFLAVLAGCSRSAPDAAAQSVTLVFSGRIDGEIEPCG